MFTLVFSNICCVLVTTGLSLVIGSFFNAPTGILIGIGIGIGVIIDFAIDLPWVMSSRKQSK